MIAEIDRFNPSDHRKLRRFLMVQKRLYANEPRFVPPLHAEMLGVRVAGMPGLLAENHPAQGHLKVRYFMAREGRRDVGRIAAIVNDAHNRYHDEKTGFFGFFDVPEDEGLARQLIGEASEWLRAQGMQRMRGPACFSSNEEWGCLIEGFDEPHYYGTPYNFPYVGSLIEKAGLKKVKDLVGIDLPVTLSDETRRVGKLQELVERIKRRHEITTRPVDLTNLEAELPVLHRLYQDAWRDNWGFVPMTLDEFRATAENLKLLADTRLFRVAEMRGEPVAFAGTLPDLNDMVVPGWLGKRLDLVRALQLLIRRRRNRYSRVRLLLMGIDARYRNRGLDAMLFYDLFDASREMPWFNRCELSWMLEDNERVISVSRSLQGKVYRRWRLYEMSL